MVSIFFPRSRYSSTLFCSKGQIWSLGPLFPRDYKVQFLSRTLKILHKHDFHLSFVTSSLHYLYMDYIFHFSTAMLYSWFSVSSDCRSPSFLPFKIFSFSLKSTSNISACLKPFFESPCHLHFLLRDPTVLYTSLMAFNTV